MQKVYRLLNTPSIYRFIKQPAVALKVGFIILKDSRGSYGLTTMTKTPKWIYLI